MSKVNSSGVPDGYYAGHFTAMESNKIATKFQFTTTGFKSEIVTRSCHFQKMFIFTGEMLDCVNTLYEDEKLVSVRFENGEVVEILGLISLVSKQSENIAAA